MEEENACQHCNKKFKTKKSKSNHILKQICIPKEKKTYCKLCSFSGTNKQEYEKHLLSIEHINKINNIQTHKIELHHNLFDLDPYLSKKEKKAVINKNDVEHVIFKHKNNTISKVNIKQLSEKARIEREMKEAAIEREKQIKKEADEAKKYINHIHYVEEPEDKIDYQSIINAELYSMPKLTETQERIMRFLVKAQVLNDNKKKEKFKQILKLIGMKEANYMTSHIRRNEELNIAAKQFYLNLIEKFISELIKLLNKGHKKLGDKDIQLFIAKLSK